MYCASSGCVCLRTCVVTDGRWDFISFVYIFLFTTEVLKCVFLFQNYGQALTCHHKLACPALCHSRIWHHLCCGQSIRKRQSVSIGFA